jgi:hypothetical protein
MGLEAQRQDRQGRLLERKLAILMVLWGLVTALRELTLEIKLEGFMETWEQWQVKQVKT